MVPEQHPLRELALFAGAGGGILGGKLLGWRTVCAVEIEPYCREVLMRRQNEGHLDPFPVWDDVRTFDGRPWRGLVDVVSGGFPCQDISVAGKGAGIEGERSGLWREMARIIGEVRPSFAFVENSPALVRRGIGVVLGDLAALGYDARWGIVSAADCGAPHQRERVWIVAHATQKHDSREREHGCCGEHNEPAREPGRSGLRENLSNANEAQCQGMQRAVRSAQERADTYIPSMRWPDDPAEIPESNVGRVVDDVAFRVDRLAAIGNGQVPIVAATAWRILTL